MIRRTVWLVGMMGAGKSTVGPRLAKRLGRSFVDADAEIERAAGASVAEIFESEGEAAFRAREAAHIEKLAKSGAVVALGGGAIARPGAADELAKTGVVVYLRCRATVLLARVGDCSERPLLRDVPAADRLAKLEALVAERRPHYETASITVDTDASSVEAAVLRIAGEIERRQS